MENRPGVRAAVLAQAVLVVLFAQVGTTGQASAQLAGSVVDVTDDPISNARVELWDGSQRVALYTTGADGRFRFSSAVTEASHALIVRRIGYRTERSILPLESPGRIVLHAAPVRLEGVVVDGPERRLCPNSDDPDARRYWEQIANRYSRGTDTLGVATAVATYRDEIHASQFDRTPPERAVPLGVTGTAGLYRRQWRQIIAERGYGYEAEGSIRTGEGLWRYPSLHRGFAHHFIDPLFGELHTFEVIRSGTRTVTISFCPRRRPRIAPVISGHLVISRDGSIAEAEWRFTTPVPHEHAGGHAEYVPRDYRSEDSFLLPATATFWRQLQNDWFYREARRYTEWRIGSGDEIPAIFIDDSEQRRGAPEPNE